MDRAVICARTFVIILAIAWTVLYTIAVGHANISWQVDLIIKPVPVVVFLIYLLAQAIKFGFNRTVILMVVSYVFQIAADELLAYDRQWDPAFYIGLGSFLVGHIFHAVAFSLAPYKGMEGPKLHILRFIPFVLLGVGIFCTIAFTGPGEGLGTVSWIALPIYDLTLAVVAWRCSARLGYHSVDSTYSQWIRLIGYLLYIASDSTIAIDKFAHPISERWVRTLLVFSTYYLANAFIVTSIPLKVDRSSPTTTPVHPIPEGDEETGVIRVQTTPPPPSAQV